MKLIYLRVLKENMGIFSSFLLNYFNNIINSSSFLNHLKLANNNSRLQKWLRKFFWPVSLLTKISKVFENILNQQISVHFKNIFCKQKTGLRRGFNTQHYLLVMLEKFRKALDKGSLLCCVTYRSVKSIWLYISWFNRC